MRRLQFKNFLLGASILFFVLASFINCQNEGNARQMAASLKKTETKAEIKTEVAKDSIPQLDTVKTSELVSIIGVGDMMLGTNYPSASYLPPKGGTTMLADVEHILKDADVTFGNLEGTILDKGGTAKRCSNPSLCYVFRSPESYVQHFTKAGFDVLSIANNHSGDFGPVGRQRTKAVLDEAGISYAGLAGTDESSIFERNGLKYGFCAFAPNRGTCDIRNITKAKSIVAELEKQVDIVIVSFHGGAEGSKHQHVPKKTETYYGENRGNVYQFAHAVIDAGADIVFGHGPHVTRAVELYKDRFITYSMGNFCTYGRFNVRGVAGIAPIFKIYTNRNGAFSYGEITSIFQQKTHGPKLDEQNRAINKIIELTKSDFPDTPLRIDEEGRIERI